MLSSFLDLPDEVFASGKVIFINTNFTKIADLFKISQTLVILSSMTVITVMFLSMNVNKTETSNSRFDRILL